MERFCNDLESYLDQLLPLPGRLLICGDVNCPRKGATGVAPVLARLLSSKQLVQRVKGPTHKHGNLLDVLITNKYSVLLAKPKLIDIGFSDHKLVKSELYVGRSHAIRRCRLVSVATRQLKSVKHDDRKRCNHQHYKLKQKPRRLETRPDFDRLGKAQIPLCRLPRGRRSRQVRDKPVTSPLAQIPLRRLSRNFPGEVSRKSA